VTVTSQPAAGSHTEPPPRASLRRPSKGWDTSFPGNRRVLSLAPIDDWEVMWERRDSVVLLSTGREGSGALMVCYLQYMQTV